MVFSIESIESLHKVIEIISSGASPPMKEDWLIKDYQPPNDKIPLGNVYLKRGHMYEKLGLKERACGDYQKACDLGDCEMFNANCK